ncbi:MAG TPA: VOC family protein [Allocoleopsis sp.]
MQLQDLYSIVVTDKLQECQDFYTRWFGFQIGFASSWFVYLIAENRAENSAENSAENHSPAQALHDRPFGLALMSTDHPSAPPGPERFNGKGMCLEFQVADAAAEYERLREAGLAIAYPLKDEPWGQRRFGVCDPTGVWIDIVQQIAPLPGYWEPYTRTEKACTEKGTDDRL